MCVFINVFLLGDAENRAKARFYKISNEI